MVMSMERPTTTAGSDEPVDLQTFRFEGINQAGAIEAGEMVSVSEHEVLERMRRRGLRPIAVDEAKKSLFDRELSIPGFGPRVKKAELAVMARQFATMVNAGIPLIRSLTVLRDQAANPLLQSTLSDMEASVSGGDSLSQAMSRHPAVFDELFVSMVRAGEAAGALDVVLQQLAGTLERSVAVANKVRSAMSYPIAVLVMVVLVIAAMLIFVVPVFTGIYADLGGTLPLPTRMLVLLSDAMTTHLPFVILGVALTGFTFHRWKNTPAGALRWDRIKLAAPLVGPLIHKGALARMGRTLSVLTRSGVPVLETLRIAADTTGNRVVTAGLVDAIDGVRNGESIASNLARHPVFPAMVIQLVTVGEETGSLEEMLEVIGRTYEGEVESAVAGFAAVIEPLLMALIGLIVGGMVIALYLPMFRIIDLVQ
jgi:type IV pilus assembly protein PilC